MLSPQKNKWRLCVTMEVLAKMMMVIILQYVSYQINTLYTLNVHNVIGEFYLRKLVGGKRFFIPPSFMLTAARSNPLKFK